MNRWGRWALLGLGSVVLSVGVALPVSHGEAIGAEGLRPRTGGQLFAQRLATLQAGQLHSRIAPGTFADRWQTVAEQPTYEQWQSLLAHEAALMAHMQGNSSLTVLMGDSIALWLPPEQLAGDRLWLNQSISGETTAQMVRRVRHFAPVRPSTIYLLAGANDLKNGADPAVVVSNLELIAQRLRRQHPQARIVVLSVLPTRLPNVPPAVVQGVNGQVAIALQRRGVEFRDLQPGFMDSQGQLRTDLTTDGLHLNGQGYSLLATYLR